MQSLWDSIKALPFDFLYLLLDMLDWLLNLVPQPSTYFDLQTLYTSLPSNLIMLLGYVQVYNCMGIIASALAIRAILMIFGR